MSRPFAELLERPAFVFSIGCAAALTALMLGYVAYFRFTMHQVSTAGFALAGAVMVGHFSIRYFRDARRLKSGRDQRRKNA